MKHLTWFALLCALAVAVFAGDYTAVPFGINNIETNDSQQTATKYNITGKAVRYAIELEESFAFSTALVTVATHNGIGGSLGGARTLIDSVSVTQGFATNFASPEYLYNDAITVTVTNISTNSVSFESLLILE